MLVPFIDASVEVNGEDRVCHVHSERCTCRSGQFLRQRVKEREHRALRGAQVMARYSAFPLVLTLKQSARLCMHICLSTYLR